MAKQSRGLLIPNSTFEIHSTLVCAQAADFEDALPVSGGMAVLASMGEGQRRTAFHEVFGALVESLVEALPEDRRTAEQQELIEIAALQIKSLEDGQHRLHPVSIKILQRREKDTFRTIKRLVFYHELAKAKQLAAEGKQHMTPKQIRARLEEEIYDA